MGETGDSTLGLNDTRLTHSLRHAQNIVREYGDLFVKSTAIFILPQPVEEKVQSMSVLPLGFLDESEVAVKANGFVLQVRLPASEELPMILYEADKPAHFAVVKNNTGSIATTAPGSGLQGS